MFVTPFTYMAAPAGGGWTPANLTNLWDWWTASSGVATTGSDVDTWTGYNGNVFSPYNGTYKASYSATDVIWGNQPSITLNPTNVNADCGYVCLLDNIAKTGTVILVGYMITKFALQETCLWANSMPNLRYAMFSNLTNSNYLTYDVQASPQVVYGGSNLNNGEYFFIRGDQNYISGGNNFYASNTNNLSNLITTLNSPSGSNYNTFNLTLGSYTGVYGPTSKFSVVEMIKIDGIPSAGEISDIETYITNKYGIS